MRAKTLAETALRQAEATGDSESVERLKYLLERWATFDDSQLIWAAAVKLKALPPTSGVSRRLMDGLPSFNSRFLQSPMREAAWLHAQTEDLKWLRERLQSRDAIQRATAVCILAKFRQHPNCEELLDDEVVEVRLAAARVLTFTNVQQALDVLLDLLQHTRHDLRAESRYLLRAIYKHTQEVGRPQR